MERSRVPCRVKLAVTFELWKVSPDLLEVLLEGKGKKKTENQVARVYEIRKK